MREGTIQKRISRWLPLLLLLQFTVAPLYACEAYKSAIVIDADSGRVLLHDCPDVSSDPASMVKMMLVLIALEDVAAGTASLDSIYTVTAAASRIGGHQVYLKQGEQFPLGELLKAVMIGSANDAAYAVAEHLSGSEAAFVERMNRRAAALGMKATRFYNSHGLPTSGGKPRNRTTAHDMARLARRLIDHPLAMTWATTRLDTFRNGTFDLLNTNHRFLRNYEGAQGLKTGYHPRGAGFSMAAVAKRANRRLIAVMLGAESSRSRLQSIKMVLDRGFANR